MWWSGRARRCCEMGGSTGWFHEVLKVWGGVWRCDCLMLWVRTAFTCMVVRTSLQVC